MRLERIRESETAELVLSTDEVAALSALGKELASKSHWWGDQEEADEQDNNERSVIHVRPATGGRWQVRVSDAVGLISVGDLQIEVAPKVPVPHLLFLLEEGEFLPRLGEGRAQVAGDDSLWTVVARWYLNAVERLLRQGLSRGYHGTRDVLKVVRGSVSTMGTARLFYSGRAEFDCIYEDFSMDTPLNRILQAASRRVAGSPALPVAERRRARRICLRMDDVGPVRRSDFRAVLSRETIRYRDAVQLAVHILQDEGRGLTHGTRLAWSFLVRTPDAVEAGIRNLLRKALAPRWDVRKERRIAKGSSVSFSPDLVFDDTNIGDVKYRLASKDWQRSDLYQSLAFMTAFGAKRALVVGFQTVQGPTPPIVHIEGQEVSYVAWRAAMDIDPQQAAADLVERVRGWLGASRALGISGAVA